MKVDCFKFGLIHILMAFAVMLSIVFIIPLVSAGGVTSTPGGKTIVVTPGQEFLLRQEFYFNDPESGGIFAMAIYWDAPSSDENFTLENAPSVYWTSGPETGLPVENVQWDNNINISAPPGQWEITAGIDAADKNYVDGHFNVDIWLRAASGDGTPHSTGKQQLTYGVGIAVVEATPVLVPVDNVTIDVRETLPSEHTEFPLLPVAIAVVIIVIAIIAILTARMRRRPKVQKPSI